MLSVFEPNFNWQKNIHNIFKRNPLFSFPSLLFEFPRILPLPPREMGNEQRRRELHVPGIFQKYPHPADGQWFSEGIMLSRRQHILIGTEKERIHIFEPPTTRAEMRNAMKVLKRGIQHRSKDFKKHNYE